LPVEEGSEKVVSYGKAIIKIPFPKKGEEVQEVSAEGSEETSELTYTSVSKRVGPRHRRRRS